MIVFNRKLRESDLSDLKMYGEELIFYKNNDIAYSIIKTEEYYIVKKYQILNNKLINTVTCKTILEVIEAC